MYTVSSVVSFWCWEMRVHVAPDHRAFKVKSKVNCKFRNVSGTLDLEFFYFIMWNSNLNYF